MKIFPFEFTSDEDVIIVNASIEGKFKFRLALDTKKAVMPALIFNSKIAMPADKTLYVVPRRLYMHFLPPVPIEAEDTVERLKQRVFEKMKIYYEENLPNKGRF